MAEQSAQPATTDVAGRKEEKLVQLRPTLFIGVGGTGMEVLMRVRRRILNALWNGSGGRAQVEGLTDFPVAQFIQFDLDSGAVIDAGRSQADDLQFDAVKFTDDERIVETFDIEKYSRDDDSLARFPHIQSWSPLVPKKIRDLNIDPSKGAGQIRAIARLYFFDKYTKVRDKVRLKLKALKSGLSRDQQLKLLGLEMDQSKFRVVVVASVAGGTGSGSFLDIGMLSKWLAKSEVGSADVELMLFLPTGFSGANKDRTEGNGYAALMEIESAMRGYKGYVGKWDAYDQPVLPLQPFDEVYLIDSGNLAQQHTADIKDVFHMVADTLFEDFASADFASRKRSIAVNQRQHKITPFSPPVPAGRFGDMKLTYYRGFSALGQAVLDTRQEALRDDRAHRWAGEMLKAFFGVGGVDLDANRATDRQRDEFMATYMLSRPVPFGDFPTFSSREVELKRSSGEFTDYLVVDELLRDRQGELPAGVQQRVDGRLEAIKSGFQRGEWPTQVREAVKQLERDAMRDQDSTADTTEDRVTKRSRELLGQIRQVVRLQLYAYLDNKEYGGLEYVLSLVEQIKDRLENAGSGMIAALQRNAGRYEEIKEAVRTHEYERLMSNLAQAKGGFLGGGEKQSVAVMDHLRIEIANALKFHLRAKAAAQAASLMAEVSEWLGRKTGIDAQGRGVWSGLVGEFQAGRQAVLDMLAQLDRNNAIHRIDLKKEHATLIAIEAPQRDMPMPGAAQMREWADDAFKDIGGSKALFPMLAEREQRSQIMAKVKRMAERQIAMRSADEGAVGRGEPLIEALEKMSPVERQRRFTELLARAMPWIDANLSRDFTPSADQYKCFIGVARADEFQRKFGAEIVACVPTEAGLTSAQVSISDTGVPGRAVCYCELSGIPLTILRGLEVWRTSYRKEGEKIPLHTHIDSTQFSHPVSPSTDELNRLAEDFKNFLLAVMLGVLTRSTQRVVPPGQYQFAVARGDVRRIGNERAIRQNGLPAAYRDLIVERVQDRLADLDAHQLAALAALATYYETAVYTPKLVADESGAQQVRKGFASAIAAEASRELHDRARRKGQDDRDVGRIGARLGDMLRRWAEPIADSDADAYEWEVREPDDDGTVRLKYAMKADAFEPGVIAALLSGHEGSGLHPAAGIAAAATAAVPPPLLPGGLPPPLAVQYHLGVDGQQYGPFPIAQVVQMIQAGQLRSDQTKVWRPGLPDWVELKSLPELAVLPVAPPPLVPPRL